MTRWMLAVFVFGTMGCGDKCGGGGGPGGWLVGQDGLMAQVDDQGHLGDGYDLGRTVDLYGIACRGADDAFVAGAGGTMLRTDDAGATWSAIDVGTAAPLRAVAASQGDAVLVAGDGAFLISDDGGDRWRPIAAPVATWTSVTTTADGALSLAVGDGQVWRWDGAALAPVAVASGRQVRAVVAYRAEWASMAAAVGDGVWRSNDGGATWTEIALPEAVALEDVSLSSDGAIVAVGAGGAVVRVAPLAVTGAVEHVTGATLRTLHLDADGLGFAAGDRGEVLRSDDGGATWTPLALGLDRTVFAMDQIGVWSPT